MAWSTLVSLEINQMFGEAQGLGRPRTSHMRFEDEQEDDDVLYEHLAESLDEVRILRGDR